MASNQVSEKVTPSVNSLVYLFGDLFVEKASVGLFGEEVPCRNIKVHRKHLAAAMVKAAFANLVEGGNLTLQAAKEKQLVFMTVDVVNATRVKSPDDAIGLERAIVNHITGQKGDNVKNIIYRLIGRDVDDPWGTILAIGRNELVEAGYFTSEQRTGIGKILGAKLTPVCEQISGLEQAARQVKERLDAFEKRDPQLANLLTKQIESGISSREKKQDLSD